MGGFNIMSFAADPVDYAYMDRVLSRIIERGLTFRLYHTLLNGTSPSSHIWMDQYGFTDMKELYVFDANGQTIQMLGGFGEKDVSFEVPVFDKQWCAEDCPDGQLMGQFDPDKVYEEDTSDVCYHAVIQRNLKYNRNDDNPLLQGDDIVGRIISKEEMDAATGKSKGNNHLYILIISFSVI